MNSTSHVSTSAPSKTRLWIGRSLSGLALLFLTFDGVFKLIQPTPKPVTDSMIQLGYNPQLALTLGVLVLVCTLLYAIPRTAFLGAILLTGYLGGAVASHLRIEQPLFSHVLFPTYIAALTWAGLFLRNRSLRLFISAQRD